MSALEQAQAALAGARVVFDARAVRDAIARCAVQIDIALRGSNPILITVLQGGIYFAGQLLPLLRFPLQQASVHVSRYGGLQSGDLVWHARPTLDVQGRTVLLVDDVFDEGLTLSTLTQDLLESGAERVYAAVLADKNVEKKTEFRPDIAALRCSDAYLFGCGMDYQGYWRNLPEIYEVSS